MNLVKEELIYDWIYRQSPKERRNNRGDTLEEALKYLNTSFIRFVNKVGRVISLNVQNCFGEINLVSQLAIYEEILILTSTDPEHTWVVTDANDSGTFKLVTKSEPTSLEKVVDITTGLQSLKDLSMLSLASRFYAIPRMVEQLPLPSFIQKQITKTIASMEPGGFYYRDFVMDCPSCDETLAKLALRYLGDKVENSNAISHFQ